MNSSAPRTPKWYLSLLTIYLAPLVIIDFLFDVYHVFSFKTSSGLFGSIDLVGLAVFGWLYVFPILASIVLLLTLTVDLRNRVIASNQKRILLFTVLLTVLCLILFYIAVRSGALWFKIPGFIHPMEALLALSSVIGSLFYSIQRGRILRSEP